MSTASPSAGRRIFALWFPRLATDRIWRGRLGPSWRSAPPQPPLAVARKEKNRYVLSSLDERAEALGLKAGTGVADARGMHPALEVLDDEPEARRRLLETLADWCDRYTPLVALEGESGLFLDISGCAHLFGGESPMGEDALARLRRQGFCARAGLASTPGAAWAASRIMPPLEHRPEKCAAVFGKSRRGIKERQHGTEYGVRSDAVGSLRFPTIAPGMEETALKPLPIWALRIGEPARQAMESVGLRTVEAVIAAPRAPLARRFGPEPLRRLDQALGRAEEAIEPRRAPGVLSAERHLAEPITETPAVEAIAGSLAETLKDDLEKRGEGARLLELALFRVDGVVFRLMLKTTRPVSDPRFVVRILRERLAALEGRIEAGFGFDVLRLSVLATAPVADRQADWLGEEEGSDEAFGLLVDRLRARLGDEALLEALPASSHVPERAAALAPFRQDRGEGSGNTPDLRRPLRLFAPPERIEVTAAVPDGPPLQFRWRRVLYRVAASEGPERIAPEWWHDETGPVALELEARTAGGDLALTRDYFRVEDYEGRRFWLFRQGLYAAALNRAPCWFLHGAFA